jgi:hypothetical protein
VQYRSGLLGLYSEGGLYSGGGAYIWNEVSVSTCGGLIHGGAYIQRFTLISAAMSIFLPRFQALLFFLLIAL